MSGHSGSVYCLAPAFESGCYYSGAADGIVAKWKVGNASPMPFSVKVGAAVFSILPMPSKGLLLVGQSAGGIHVIDVKERKEIRHLKYHENGVFKIVHAPNSNHLITLGADGNCAVISDDDFRLMLSVPLSAMKLRCAVFSGLGDYLLVGGTEGFIKVLDAAYYNEWNTVDAHEGGVYCMLWLSDDTLVSGGRDGHLRFWKFEDKILHLVDAIPAHNFAIYDLVISPDGKRFASASRDKTVKIWSISDLYSPIRLSREGKHGHTHSVNALYWHPSPEMLISAGDDRKIIAWSV